MLGAALALVCGQGFDRMSVTAIVERAGVSRKTFYDLFGDLEGCRIALIEDCIAEIAAVVVPAYEASADWPARLREALLALLGFFERERDVGAIVAAYLRGALPGRAQSRARVLELLCAAIEEGRPQDGPATEPPRLAGEFVLGGVIAVIEAHLRTPERPLLALLNPLMWMIVMPYRGSRAARRELTGTVPSCPPSEAVRVPDPLRGLAIRLTYRTVSVLQSIAHAPGVSNVEVCERAGIADQGQASKLLRRLARLGLAENQGGGQHGGGSNAWYLSAKGEQLVAAIERRPLPSADTRVSIPPRVRSRTHRAANGR
ncbi:MAG TPA: TetR/AcrR family transcriptional regulator [Solirubrobacteraceae bacterium]|nr:TetR/AcrR family transcriptional regulator [Solirubrobacteraceae bacterium]